MDTLPPSTLAWRGVGFDPAGWAPPPAAVPGDAAGRQAASWFNEPLGDDSRVLRTPVQPGAGDAQALCQRFLACLTPDAA